MLFEYNADIYLNKYSDHIKLSQNTKCSDIVNPIEFEQLMKKMKEESITKDILENNDYSNIDHVTYKNKLSKPMNFCPNCKADALQYEPHYGIVCIECGRKIHNIMTNNSEWQEYNQSKIGCLKDDARCSNYSSTIVPNIGRKMTFKGLNYYSPLNQIHAWSETSYKDKSMYKTYRDMLDTFQELELNHVVIEAFKVYKRIYEKKLYRGRNRRAIKAGCILYVTRKSDDPKIRTISPLRIGKVSGLSKNAVLNGHKKVKEILHRYNLGSTDTAPLNTDDYIAKHCNTLGIDDINQKYAQELMNGLQILGTVSDNTNKTQITGCIYTIVCMNNIENISKEEIVDVCGISDVTLSKCFNKILTVIDQIIKLDSDQKTNLGI